MLRLLIAILLAVPAIGQTVHNFRSNGPHRYNLNLFQTVQPGDTIEMGGRYMYVYFDGIRGTRQNPVIIRLHKDSSIQIGGNNNTGVAYGFIITNSYHFKLQGFDTTKAEIYKPTDTLTQGFGFGTSHNFEAGGFTIRYANAGIYARPSTGGRRANIVLKDFVIRDQRETNTVPRGTCEGVYIGSTSLLDTSVTYYDSITLDNIRVYDGDGDGIQVAMARNLIVRNCSVTNWARTNIPAQRSAYIFGGSTQGLLENCTAVAGPGRFGTYWQLFGSGLSIGRNLSFSGAGSSTNEAGIYLDEKSTLAEQLQLRLENVSINGTAAAGIRNDDATAVQLCNVSFANIGTTNTQGFNFSSFTTCAAPPPPPPPTRPDRTRLRNARPVRLRIQ